MVAYAGVELRCSICGGPPRKPPSMRGHGLAREILAIYADEDWMAEADAIADDILRCTYGS